MLGGCAHIGGWPKARSPSGAIEASETLVSMPLTPYTCPRPSDTRGHLRPSETRGCCHSAATAPGHAYIPPTYAIRTYPAAAGGWQPVLPSKLPGQEGSLSSALSPAAAMLSDS